jgi:undecaprenyl pyrophosphate synthase
MEDVFQKHKPRWKDFINLFRLDTLKAILSIPEHFQLTGDIFKVLENLFTQYPYLIGLCCVIANLDPIIRLLNYEDSIFLHHIQTLKRLFFEAGNLNMNTAENHTERGLCIGIIPDGNRRWAKENHLPTHIGHFIGASRIADIIRYSCLLDSRIRHIVVYVLSYDNLLKRSPDEQNALINLLKSWIEEFDLIHRSGQADISVIGEPTEEIRDILSETSLKINPVYIRDSTPRLKVSLLLCYDGRREIQYSGGDPDRLWLPEPIDAVIRTGNTRRASGFCTYQTAYSEWFYPEIMWPDMSIGVFKNIVDDIARVEQNYGK